MEFLGVPRGTYSSSLGCIRAMWQEEGLKAFTRGLSARIMKIGIGQAVIFSIYETVYSFVSENIVDTS